MARRLGQRRRGSRLARSTSFHGDEGFTLIELLVVVVILPLVVGAIAIGLVSVFSLQTKTTSRLSGTGDLQTVNATFVKDVQSAAWITNEPTVPVCGSPTNTQLLGLLWSGPANAPANQMTTAVSYVSVPMNNGTTNFSLERLYCTLSNFAAPETTTVISADLSGTQPLASICAPTFTTTSPSTCTATPLTAPEATSTIAAVMLPLFVPMDSNPYTMVATPRAGGNTPGGIPSTATKTPPLMLLGTGCPVLSVGNSTDKKASGLTINESTSSGTGTGNGLLGINSTCSSAISISNGGSIAAGAILTPNPGNSVSVSGGYSGTLPNQEGWSGSTDPFAGMAPPMSPTTSATCKYISSSSTYYCPPGLYTTDPNFSNGSTIIFQGGGNYQFNFDFKVPNNSTVTFATGAYIFNASDANAFATGKNVALYSYDALLYAPNGSMTFYNNTLVTMTAPSSWIISKNSDGTYNYGPSNGVAVWDGASYNPATGSGLGIVTLANNSTQNNSYGGIYVPNGEVVDSQNGTIDVTFILASYAVFSNGLTVNISS